MAVGGARHCSNWVSSPEPLDTPLDPMLPDCPRVSAGHRTSPVPWRSACCSTPTGRSVAVPQGRFL
ncbi:Protein FAM172A [Liparis tanakae]|uniref:Protein FAM172A n=1 Tax=Liparis tanakae TaxID=230148 RepID=A0A4Z2F974_9TELE|nr:Protein FAM172A [Liparis tanakae]